MGPFGLNLSGSGLNLPFSDHFAAIKVGSTCGASQVKYSQMWAKSSLIAGGEWLIAHTEAG